MQQLLQLLNTYASSYQKKKKKVDSRYKLLLVLGVDILLKDMIFFYA